MADKQQTEQHQLEPGSSYLFNADAQAILEESPDLDTGLNLLTESYAAKDWDDKKAASAIASNYATQLRQRFEDTPDYAEEDTLSLAPVDLPVIKASGDAPVSTVVDQINTWENANLQFLEETQDPDFVVLKDKLGSSIRVHASELRRQAQGKDISWLGDKFNRAQEGLTGGIAKLVGAEEYLKNLHEHTNPSADDDLSSAIASGAGSFVGAVGAGALTGGYGTLAYLAATGAGEVKSTYEDSLKATGDSQRAKIAGALEVGSQGLQTVIGQKVFGKLGGTISKKLFGKPIEQTTEKAIQTAAKSALIEGTTETAGGIVSNKARQYGTNNSNIGVLDDSGNNFIVGAIFGGAAGGIDSVLSRSRATPEEGLSVTETVTDPIEKTVIGAPVDSEGTQAVQNRSAAVNVLESEGALPPEPAVQGDFVTSDGSRYSTTPEGATARTKVATQEQFHPLDRTFFLDKEKAGALATLRSQTQPDGATPQILTDGEHLIVKGDYINEDLSISDTPTGRRLTFIDAQEQPAVGAYPVEVNRPKNLNGNERLYQSHIGREITEVIPRTVIVETPEGKSGGAAFTKERKLGTRLRLSSGLEEDIRSGFGDEEGGYARYVPVPQAETTDAAKAFIAEKGVENAIIEVLALPDTHADTTSVEIARQLVQQFNVGVNTARAAGDTVAAEKMAAVAIEIGDKAARILTNAGRTVDIAKLWNSFDPGLRVLYVRRKLKEAALKETAAEEGISSRELEKIDPEITTTQEQIDTIQAEGEKAKAIVEDAITPEIQEATKLAGAIEKEAEQRLKAFQDQEAKLIEQAEQRATEIEEEATQRVEKEKAQIEEGIKAAEARIDEINKKSEQKAKDVNETFKKSKAAIQKLETVGQERAVTAAEKELATAETVLKKLTDRAAAGEKVNEKAIENTKRGIEKLKTRRKNASPEEGLNVEERKELRRLRRLAQSEDAAKTVAPENVLSAAEKAELDKLKALIEKGNERLKKSPEEKALSDAERAKISKLRALSKEKKERVAKATKDDFLSKKEQNQLNLLNDKKIQLRDQKAKQQKSSNAQDYLSADQKAKLAELTKRKQKLTARKEKLAKKIKEKQSKFSPAQEEKLNKLLTAAQKTGGTLQQKLLRDAVKIEQQVADESPQKGSIWHTMWLANQLSDPSTQAVNLIGNAYQVASNVLSYTATGALQGRPLDGARFLGSFLKAARNEGTDAFLTELKGVRTFRPQSEKLGQDGGAVTTRGIDTREDFVKEAPAWVKSIGLNNLGYVFRMLSATDAGFYKSLQEAQAAFIARDGATRKGLSGVELKNYVSEQLFDSTENWNNALRAAEAESALLKELGYKQDARQERLRAWEILEQKRPEALRQEVHTFASKATFTNTPEGVVGGIVRGMSAMANAPLTIKGKTIKPLRYVFAFLNVAGNILNANIDHTPFGAVRALDPNLSALEKRNQVGKFMVGTVLAATIYGMAREYENDDDPYFTIHGSGPTDPNKNRQWRDTGARPYSVKVGDRYFQYKETPFGLMLGALGAWLDAERYNKGYARQSGVAALSTIIGGMGKAFVNNSFLKNMSDFIEGIAGDSGKNPIDAVLINPIKGFVPFAGSLRAITKLVQDPIETYGSFWAKFSSGIPFAQSIGTKPALNAFGEPIERTFEDRLSFIGRFYSERVTDPDWRWLAENNYYIPDAGGFTIEIPTKGKATAAQRNASLGAAFEGVLTQQERYEFMKRQGPQVRALIAQYRQKYGGSGHQDKVQERLSSAIGDIRSRVKREMFLR